MINKKNLKLELSLIKDFMKELGGNIYGEFPQLAIIAVLAVIIAPIMLLSQPDNTTQTNSTPNQTQTQKVEIEKHEPIPQQNIKTQYVEEAPIHNNTGHASLTIDNTRNNTPVYARLWIINSNNSHAVRTFTIAPYNSFTLENLTEGKYKLRYKELYEDENDIHAYKSDSMDIVSNNVQYSKTTLTLYKVRNGNAETYPINPNNI